MRSSKYWMLASICTNSVPKLVKEEQTMTWVVGLTSPTPRLTRCNIDVLNVELEARFGKKGLELFLEAPESKA